MALIETRTVCANVGTAWAAFLNQWQTVLLAGVGTVSGVVVNDLGVKTMRVVRAHPPDTNIWYFNCADILETAVNVPAPYVLGSPNWRRVPTLVADAVGAYNTRQFFEDHARAVRRAVFTSWCGATFIDGTRDSSAFTPMLGLLSYEYSDRYQLGPIMFTDAYSLQVTTTSTSFSLYGGAQTTDGLLAGSPSITVANGLSAQDIETISQGLQDIATVDFDYTANNGRSIFSMRGRVNAGT